MARAFIRSTTRHWLAAAAAAAVLTAPGLGAQGHRSAGARASNAANLGATSHAAHGAPAPAAIAAPVRMEAHTTADGMVLGPATAIGNGIARAYVINAGDRPLEVGVLLSEGALDALPGHHAAGGTVGPDGHSTFETLLALPDGNLTPYQYVVLNWNPGGHEPPGVYDNAHFDFHFYTISDADRLRIGPDDPAFQAKTERLPAPEFVPEGYVAPVKIAFPRMGLHWVDPRSPELNGRPFTRTFIFGSYDGRINFAEPMLTKAFLESRPDETIPVPFATRYAAAGWQPGAYVVRWEPSARRYRIALTQLTWKE